MAATSPSKPRILWNRLWWAGPATVGAAVAANAVVRFVLLALFVELEDFLPMDLAAVVTFTALASFLAVIVFVIAAVATNEPVRIYRIVAVVVLLFTFVPPILRAMNPSAGAAPDATSSDYLLLLPYHITAFLICVFMLPPLVLAQE